MANRKVAMLGTMLAVIVGCADSHADAHVVSVVYSEASLETGGAVVLSDHGHSLLARPRGFADLPQGLYAIGDWSDLDIKIYDYSGMRVSTLGRPGDGPGEFRSLRSLSTSGGSLFAYDFANRRMSYFDVMTASDGISVIHGTPYDARIIEDSLSLHVFHPGQRQPLLGTAPVGGEVRQRFLSPPWLDEAPSLRRHTATFADAADGFIHAIVFGSNIVYTFDYHGMPVRSREIPGLDSILERWKFAGEVALSADGEWFHHGIVSAMDMLALPGGCAAITVATYDTEFGTDLLEGSELIVLPPPTEGGPAVRLQLPGHAIGVDRSGQVVILSYEDYLTGTMRMDFLRSPCTPELARAGR